MSEHVSIKAADGYQKGPAMILPSEPREVLEWVDEPTWLQQRMGDLTSTDIGALFGCSPYGTEFDLWHRKKNQEPGAYSDNERTQWGKRLQDSIAIGIGEDNQWEVEPVTEYIRMPRLRMGSSFDWRIKNYKDGKPALLEIKNVDSLQFQQKWDTRDADGYIEGPPHIELQVQYQMLVHGYEHSVIGVLVGGNRQFALRRESMPDVQNAILSACVGFWRSIEAGMEPKPDYERDAQRIIDMHENVHKDKIAKIADEELFSELCRTYKDAGDRMKADDLIREICRAKMLEIIGDAAKAKTKEWSVSSWHVEPNTYTVERKAHRGLRITPRTQ